MGTTAAESLSSAGNVFLGQTEAPLLIKPYLKDLTASEINTVMTGGFATIAGTVFGVYISFGACANHLLSASFMSAPAALAMSKLIHPETEKSKTSKTKDLDLQIGTERNALEAAANGAVQGIFLVGNIVANLIAFLALLKLANEVVIWLGSLVGIYGLTIERILSYVFYPLAFLMGASWDHEELLLVAELMGIKTVINEFVAYERMGQYIKEGRLSGRSQLISTYALCGFSNLASIGVMLGALGAMCPEKQGVLAKNAIRSMIAGSVACFLTACVAGLLLNEVGECAGKNSGANVTQCIKLEDVYTLLRTANMTGY